MSTNQLERSTTVTQLPTGEDTLMFEATYPGIAPSELFRLWTEPELLLKWWPQYAELEAREGGKYHFAWPGRDYHLRGTYDTFRPSEQLAFSWHWDHDGDLPLRHVDMRFEPLGEGGTRLLLTHSAYTAADTEERQSHIDGWQHYLARLGDVPPIIAETIPFERDNKEYR